jgi:hypothetical protein
MLHIFKIHRVHFFKLPECKTEQQYKIKIGLPVINIFLENVAEFKYLSTEVTTQTYIHEEFEKRLRSGNAWYSETTSIFGLFHRILIIKTQIFRNQFCSTNLDSGPFKTQF